MLIRESTFRRILREEARRVLREVAYTPQQIEALDMQFAQVGLGSPVHDYMVAWTNVKRVLDRLQPALSTLDGKRFSNITGGWDRIYTEGAASPLASTALQSISKAQGSKMSPEGMLTALLASISTGRAYGGTEGQAGLSDVYDLTTVNQVKAAQSKIVSDPAALIKQIRGVLGFDLAGAMSKKPEGPVAGGAATGGGTDASDGGATSPTAPSPKAPAPAGDWSSYVKSTKGGAQVKAAWEAYAANPLKRTDGAYMSFVRWWNNRKKTDTSFKGATQQTIDVLRAEASTAPAAEQAPQTRAAAGLGAIPGASNVGKLR
jgi:hypothetical protein